MPCLCVVLVGSDLMHLLGWVSIHDTHHHMGVLEKKKFVVGILVCGFLGCYMVPTNPTTDISQQLLPLFDRDVALQDPSMASLVELPLNNDEGLGAMCEPPSLHFVYR